MSELRVREGTPISFSQAAKRPFSADALDLYVQEQCQTEWCWAACQSITFTSLPDGPPSAQARQCAIASKVLSAPHLSLIHI